MIGARVTLTSLTGRLAELETGTEKPSTRGARKSGDRLESHKACDLIHSHRRRQDHQFQARSNTTEVMMIKIYNSAYAGP